MSLRTIKKNTLRQVLYSSQLRFVAVAIISGLLAVILISVQRQRIIEEYEYSQKLLKSTQDIQTGLQTSIAQFKSFLLTSNSDTKNEHRRNWNDEIYPAVNQLISLMDRDMSPEVHERLLYLDREIYYLESRQWWMEDLATNQGRDDLMYLYVSEAIPLNDRLMDMLSTLIYIERAYLPKARLSKDNKKHIEIISLLNDLRSTSLHYSSEILQTASRQLSSGDIGEIEMHKLELVDLISQLKTYDRFFIEDLRLLFAAFEREQTNYFSIAQELIELAAADTDDILTRVSLIIEPKEQELVSLISNIRSIWANQYDKSREQQLFWNNALLISLVIIIVVFTYYSFMQLRKLKNSVVKPIEDTTRAIDNLISNHKVEMPDSASIEELDELVLAFTNLSNTLLVAEENMNSSQLYLSRIFNNITGAIVVANEEGVITLFNLGAQSIFGYEEEEALGKNVNLLMPDNYKAEHFKYIKGSNLDQGKSSVLGKDRSMLGQNKFGETFPISVNLRNFIYDGKKIFVTLIKEESEQQAIQKSLRQAKESAEQANNSKTKFLADMSHDLRTPLNAISGFAQLLKLDSDAGSEHQQYADDILESANFLLSMIDEMLNFSRVESGKTDYIFSCVNAADLFRKCATMTLPLADKSAVSLSFVYPDGLSLGLYADEKRTLQIMFNLIGNAIKYNRKGGRVDVYITPGVTKEDRIRISVSDNGIGISEEYHGQVFTPFSRVSEDKSMIKGTGIGLAITRRLVEDMGGDINFDSKKGQGSVFWFELPTTESFEASLNSASQVDEVLNVSKEAIVQTDALAEESSNIQALNDVDFDRTIKVIYIEDSAINRRLLEEVMKSYDNMELYCSDNALDGLSLIRDINPDVIISDINMPERDGYWLLKTIRSEAQLSHIPIIALSATAMPEDIAKAINAGFDVYQTKPFDVDELVNNIKQLVN